MGKYWDDRHRDIFEVKDYKLDFEPEWTPQWSTLAYDIRRGKTKEVKKAIQLDAQKRFHARRKFRANGETALHVCAEFGRVELFKWMAAEYAGDIQGVNDAGETPLMIAAREGKLAIVKMYVEDYQGQFDMELKMKDGWTALHYASMNGYAPVIEYLLTEGHADVNATDRLFKTCLHWAARFNNVKVAHLLLEASAKPDMTDIEGYTPTEVATKNLNPEVARAIRYQLEVKKEEAERKKKIRAEKDKARREKAAAERKAEEAK